MEILLLKTVFSERTILFLLPSLTTGWKDDAKRERRKGKNWNEKETNRKGKGKSEGTGITKRKKHQSDTEKVKEQGKIW